MSARPWGWPEGTQIPGPCFVWGPWQLSRPQHPSAWSSTDGPTRRTAWHRRQPSWRQTGQRRHLRSPTAALSPCRWPDPAGSSRHPVPGSRPAVSPPRRATPALAGLRPPPEPSMPLPWYWRDQCVHLGPPRVRSGRSRCPTAYRRWWVRPRSARPGAPRRPTSGAVSRRYSSQAITLRVRARGLPKRTPSPHRPRRCGRSQRRRPPRRERRT